MSKTAKNMDIQVIHKGPCRLAESPLWDHRHGLFYWVDIMGCKLHAFNPKNEAHQQWVLPAEPGCVALYGENDLIVGLGDRIALIRLPEGDIEELVKVLHDDVTTLNDGKCDPQGRFWVGSRDYNNEKPLASLYRFDHQQSVKEMVRDLTISNGLAWTDDQQHFLLADSIPRKVYRFDYDAKSGDISNQQVLITIPDDQGVPDGLALDDQGYIWLAHWDGWRVTRFTPEGEVDCVIDMPVARPTSCCFGGDDYQTLYVTSDSRDLTKEQWEQAPLSGAVFAIRVDATGKPEPVCNVGL